MEPRGRSPGERPVSEITAIEKHACPACGAQAEWNPAKKIGSSYRVTRAALDAYLAT